MGAEIEWSSGLIRFGKQFRCAASDHPYDGTVTVVNLGEGVCKLVGMSGDMGATVEEQKETHDSILRVCAEHFQKVQMRRVKKKTWSKMECDLTRRPFRWRPL